MVDLLKILNCTLVLLCCVNFPNDSFADAISARTGQFCSVQGVSVDSSLNIRSAPNVQSPKIGQIEWNKNEIVRIGDAFSSTYGNWVKIQHQNISGWASAAYLQCDTSIDNNLLNIATDLVSSLKSRDLDRIASVVHPDKGVRISPYAFVDIETDQMFSNDAVRALRSNADRINWGRYDGSGDVMELTFDQYYEKFLFSHDFTNAVYHSLDAAIGRGNTFNNSSEVYSTARMIEYHFPATSAESFDWASLRIFLELHEGAWKLVGLVNSQWTT